MKRTSTHLLLWAVALLAGVGLVGIRTVASAEGGTPPGAPGPTTAAPAAPSSAPPAHRAAPLWRADPATGTKPFEGVETKPGQVSVVDDPAGRYGKTYALHTSGHKLDDATRVRVETRGQRTSGGPLRFAKEGDVFYIGWRSMWGPLPTRKGDWVTLWQLKDYGSGAATPPLSLRARGDGTVDLEYCDPKLKTTTLWHTGLKLNSWHSFVVGLKISKDPAKGWVKLWHNGAAQKLAGNAAQYRAATLRAGWVTDKWGVYRSDGVTGAATAYLNDAAVGRAYGDVAP
ncbi:heparin lyase I family protein [Streptomyces sp. NPDC014733]|uniref:heparin lyase I family protein n=1 Tax=Streptomyces sp. NPDC014733 TaxID=3364885 RepID=UPI0036FC3CA5